jgi:hypothetical protein
VIELQPGEWVVQFARGINGWNTFSDVFDTQAQAQAWERNQIDSADHRDEE